MKIQALLPMVTYPDANSDAVATNAVAVAEQLGADLHALALNADIPPVSSALSRLLLDLPEMIRNAETLSRQHGDHLLKKVTKEASRRKISTTADSVSTAIALLGDVASDHARYHDVALIGWEAGNPTSRMTAEAVIFGSGRPAILLPELSSVGSIDRIAVAWDGSRVAARAVADALPFLQRASKIHVLTVVDEKPLDKDIGDRLVAALHKRGLVADLHMINAEDCDIAITLQEHAIEIGTDLLVMGGYGHSRVRDFVLGGATEGILNDLLLPVLLSH